MTEDAIEEKLVSKFDSYISNDLFFTRNKAKFASLKKTDNSFLSFCSPF